MAELVAPVVEPGPPRERRRRRRRDLVGHRREPAGPLLTPGQAQATQTLNEAMRSLLSAGGGAYLKIFRTHPLPPTFQGQLYQIETVRALEGIRDHAEHIRQLGLASGWASGTFEAHGWIEGGTEAQFRLPLAFEFPAAPGPGKADPSVAAPPPSPADQIRQVGELVTAVKTVTGEAASPDTLARMFTAGIEVAKTNSPANPISGALETLVTRLVERLLVPPPPPAAEESVQRTIQLLDSLGLIKRGEPAGAPTATDQLVQSVATAKSLVDALATLNPGGAAAAPTRASGWATFASVLPSIMPVVGQMVSQITGTVQSVIDARQRELLLRSAGATSVSRSGAAAPAVVAGASPLAPFAHAITEGIHTPEVFQAVGRAIEAAGHGGLLAAIRAGQVDAEMILTQAAPALPELALPGAEPFVAAFVAWCQAGAEAPGRPAANGAAGGKTITVQCVKCKAQGPLAADTPLSAVMCQTPTPGPDGQARPCGGPVVRVV